MIPRSRRQPRSVIILDLLSNDQSLSFYRIDLSCIGPALRHYRHFCEQMITNNSDASYSLQMLKELYVGSRKTRNGSCGHYSLVRHLPHGGRRSGAHLANGVGASTVILSLDGEEPFCCCKKWIWHSDGQPDTRRETKQGLDTNSLLIVS